MPTPASEERSVRIVGARRRGPPDPTTPELIRRLREVSQQDAALVALFDANAIAGQRHLLSAWAHLGRSRRDGSSRLRDRGAEFALYVAGADQLGRALSMVGVSDRTDAFVLVAEKPRILAELLERFGLEEDPTAYPRSVTEATLDRLGITPAEQSAVPPEAWEGLVLERVALVDLSAPAAGGASRSAPPKPTGRKR